MDPIPVLRMWHRLRGCLLLRCSDLAILQHGGLGAGDRQSHLILGMTACHSGEAMSSFSKNTASVRGGMGCLNRRDSHSDCLNELTVDEVWDALEELKVLA